MTGRCVQIRQLFLLFGERLWFCRGWPSALLETSTNQEQLSSVLLMKWNRSPLQAIHMVILPNTERHIWARLLLEIAGGGSRDCLLLQSDTHCSQSGPFYQSPYYLTLMAFSISIWMLQTVWTFPVFSFTAPYSKAWNWHHACWSSRWNSGFSLQG